MAGITFFRSGNMIETLTCRYGSIMTGDAAINNSFVIERRRSPPRSQVTAVAFLRRWNMIEALACGYGAIVTARAVSKHSRMVNQ